MERKNYIDWLRGLAVLLLFPYHAAQVFSHFQCYVENAQKSLLLSFLVQFLFQWHMHLLFLLAGMSSFYSLGRRQPGEYLKERVVRLLVPLVFGVTALVPVLKHLAFLRSPDYHGSYLELYRSSSVFFTNLGDIHWAHLWFVAYLLIYSLVSLPLLRALAKNRSPSLLRPLARLAQAPAGVILFGLVPGLLEAALRPGWPGGLFNIVDDWATFFVYWSFFLLGAFLASEDRILAGVDQSLKFLLPVSLFGMILYFALPLSRLVILPRPDALHPYTITYMAFEFFRGVNSWCWVLLLLALGHRGLNFSGRLLSWVREASYPVYILHAPVVMLIAWKVTAQAWGPLIKFGVILALSYPAVLLLYELPVRRIRLMRFLLGMRLKGAKAEEQREAQEREDAVCRKQ